MLKIRKDGVEKIVTSGAYENLYKGMGYEIITEPSTKKVATPEKVVAPKVEEKKVEEPKVEEKPVEIEKPKIVIKKNK